MKKYLMLVATLTMTPSLTLGSPVTFLGRQTWPLPAGCQQKDFGELEDGRRYSYTYLACNDQHIITLDRKTEQRDKKPEWVVVDEVCVPPMPRGYEVMLPLVCSNRLHEDDIVLAVGRWKKLRDGLEAKPIVHAWRFDLMMETIEPIATRGIDCSMDEP